MEKILIIAIIGFIAVIVVFFYNRFVTFKNKVREAWSGIDIQLKKRYNLIPNLLETVKAYAKHEKEVFEEVAKVRSMGIDADNVDDQAEAENLITGALKKLFAVAENYPELKASQNFTEFQRSLEEIEEDIEMARRYYNAIVRDNNIAIEKFPGVLFARLFKFSRYDFFEIESVYKKNVEVKF